MVRWVAEADLKINAGASLAECGSAPITVRCLSASPSDELLRGGRSALEDGTSSRSRIRCGYCPRQDGLVVSYGVVRFSVYVGLPSTQVSTSPLDDWPLTCRCTVKR